MIDCCVKTANHLRATGHLKVRKTWRTPIEKAAGDDPETRYRWLHDIADASAKDVRDAFLKAIEDLRGTIKEAELRAAVETGSIEAVMRVLGIDKKIADAIRMNVLPPLEDAMIAAGRASPSSTLPKGGELAMRFDLANPNTVRYLRSYDFGLIRQISDDTRNAIRSVVTDAMQYGGHPYEQARTIREAIGLTDNQNAAVANFRRMLEEGDSAALTRELRDKRFDRTLERTLGIDAEADLTPEQIDRMVTRYGERMLKARAENIARTETINATQAGQQLAWEQATENGLLDRSKIRQGWLVTPDDRLCIICAAIPLMNPGGVPLGGYFQTPVGPILRPTVHPQCRCALYLMAF